MKLSKILTNECMILTDVRKKKNKGRICLRKIVPLLDLDRQEFLSENVQVNYQSGAALFFFCFCSF